jgi:hypothetical protein
MNLLGVTDIDHFHWSMSEADVPTSVELENKPVSVPADVELAIIEANSRRVRATAEVANAFAVASGFRIVYASTVVLTVLCGLFGYWRA